MSGGQTPADERSSHDSHWASGMAAASRLLPRCVAEFTNTSNPPTVATVCSTAACTYAACDVSQRTNKPPAAWAVSWPFTSLMSATLTRAPSRANLRAMARPMPVAPPVIRATLSFRRISGSARQFAQQQQAVGNNQAGCLRSERCNLYFVPAKRIGLGRWDVGPAGIGVT